MKARTLIFLAVAAATLAFLLLLTKARAASRLLPFQGRLTDAQGNLIADGPCVVQFKIYDAPVGGSAVWNGEVQKLSVNHGLVSTLLGTKANLSGVDFDRDLYLELTADANNDGLITASDPPLLPRQSILPAVFAKEAADSRLLAGHDWTGLFGVNNPSGTLLPAKIGDGSLPGSKLTPASVTAAQIAPLTLNAGLIANGTITSNQIASGSIHLSNLAQLVAEALNPPGTIQAFAGPNVPPGWLLCDGSALDKDNPIYARLFSAISTSWGNGAQSGAGAQFPSVPSITDFNIPDLRGVFLRGVNGIRNDQYSDSEPNNPQRNNPYAGGHSGNQVGSYQRDAIQQHVHKVYYTAASGVSTSTRYGPPGADFNVWDAPFVAEDPLTDLYAAEITSGRASSETRPPNAYVHYIIKY